MILENGAVVSGRWQPTQFDITLILLTVKVCIPYYRHFCMFTFGVNMFVIWSIEQWCMLDICGPMAILSHQLEVKVFYLENTDVRDNQENQPFLLKVGI